MPSLIYDSMVTLMAQGTIAFAQDAFRVMLVGAAYVPDKTAHTRRGDVTGEVSGSGYVPGGADVAVAVTADAALGTTDVQLGGAEWPASTIEATGAVYYDSRGGAAANDELVAYIDFNGDVVSVSGLFSLEPSTIRITNP